jgi:hypothetical protein
MTDNIYDHISTTDGILLKTVFTLLEKHNKLDLTGKVLWVLFKKQYRLEKDYKFTKYIGDNSIHVHKYIINGKRSYISNTILDMDNVILWYRDVSKDDKETGLSLYEKLIKIHGDFDSEEEDG